MKIDDNIIRLFVSQGFLIYFAYLLLSLKDPVKKHLKLGIAVSFLITLLNGLLIQFIGISFYIDFYFLRLTIPYIFLCGFLVKHSGGKLVFALLSIQTLGNIAILNGLFASYLFFKENTPYIDTLFRVFTYLLLIPVITKYVKPTFLKMATVLDKGWWLLNSTLILAYALAYLILFVPSPVFDRPVYLIHGYTGLCLSLGIFIIIIVLFYAIDSKAKIEMDKEALSLKVHSMTKESMEITSIAYQDVLTGVKNRYSLYRKMDHLIKHHQAFAVVFIDLDNFKDINDRYDHSVGDQYLKAFAKALQETLKETGEVFRFAGDEFVGIITQDLTYIDKTSPIN